MKNFWEKLNMMLNRNTMVSCVRSQAVYFFFNFLLAKNKTPKNTCTFNKFSIIFLTNWFSFSFDSYYWGISEIHLGCIKHFCLFILFYFTICFLKWAEINCPRDLMMMTIAIVAPLTILGEQWKPTSQQVLHTSLLIYETWLELSLSLPYFIFLIRLIPPFNVQQSTISFLIDFSHKYKES